jgi:integrin-linked kinase-associated serine/threonine phosphatase 2C
LTAGALHIARHREGRAMGIVEVSRSIGDGRFKGCGLIATPHLLRCQVTDDDL